MNVNKLIFFYKYFNLKQKFQQEETEEQKPDLHY